MAKAKSRSVTSHAGETEQAFRAALWMVLGGLLGQLMQTLPVYTSFWGIMACLIMLTFSHWRHKLDYFVAGCVGALVLMAVGFCLYKAIQEYRGVNYPLLYRVCGMPTKEYGVFTEVVFGMEWDNPNKVDLYVRQADKSLTVEDRNSVLPALGGVYTLHPSGTDPGEDAKVTDVVKFDPPISPRGLTGHAHYEFKFGPRRDDPQRTLVVDGMFQVLTDDQGEAYSFHFSPSNKSSPGYIGMCDIKDQVRGEPLAG